MILNLNPKLLFLIGIICCFVGCDSISPQVQLEKWIEEQKEQKRLPHVIDKNLKLIDIRSGEMKLIQVFEIKGFGGEMPDEAKVEIRQRVVQELIAKKDQIKSLIDFGIVMTFKYQNPSQKELYEFEIDPGKDLE